MDPVNDKMIRVGVVIAPLSSDGGILEEVGTRISPQ